MHSKRVKEFLIVLLFNIGTCDAEYRHESLYRFKRTISESRREPDGYCRTMTANAIACCAKCSEHKLCISVAYFPASQTCILTDDTEIDHFKHNDYGRMDLPPPVMHIYGKIFFSIDYNACSTFVLV